MPRRSVFWPRGRTRHAIKIGKPDEIPDLHKAFREFHEEEARERRGRFARLLGPFPDGIGGNTARFVFLVLQTILFVWILKLGALEVTIATLGVAAAIWSM